MPNMEGGRLMKIIGKGLKYHAMDVLSDDEIITLEKAIKTMDHNIIITEINYEIGVIKIGYIYNKGDEDVWIKNDFMTVNVNAESVGCLFWEVINAVFHRCM